MLSVGIDLNGGDQAPAVVIEGLKLALPELHSATQLICIGQGQLPAELQEQQQLLHWPAAAVIGMDEHPVKALQSKPDNAISRGLKAVAEGKLDAFASAGHSGALMVGAIQILGLIEGLPRPAAAVNLPRPDGGSTLLLDVGVNADCKPDLLRTFARLGARYAQTVLQKKQPRISLLNTGAEPGKGSILYQKAYQLLLDDDQLNFTGNLEAREIFTTPTDVAVCDGFTGNIVLKLVESFYKLVNQRQITDPYLQQLNYEQYGGTPILGVKGNVVLGHGSSSAEAIKNMILAAESIALANFANQLTQI